LNRTPDSGKTKSRQIKIGLTCVFPGAGNYCDSHWLPPVGIVGQAFLVPRTS
jgi:hypothetical protein